VGSRRIFEWGTVGYDGITAYFGRPWRSLKKMWKSGSGTT
jgi:hypothetical protein